MIRIVESNYITSAVKANNYPTVIRDDITEWKEVAFVGRSNVGKSSMINTLTGRKLLAKVAAKPGKTRLINFFDIRYKQKNNDSEQETDNFFCLVDLPGYGYAKVSKTERQQWQTMISEYFTKSKHISGVIVLVDIRHEADPKDMIMIKMLQQLNINFIIACTKSDKIPTNKIPSHLKNIKKGFQLDKIDVIAFSSTTKKGSDYILNWIENKILYQENNTSISLNDIPVRKIIKHD
ncbi:MAG: ribosome biogenesis GTP-binding protein YihA/YsxC [Candidatus Cloacimonetes bacterium]|jgi:GTP-binding protein|nr:ribosome biogenesis GTP-binding protein YihA/YsxC [Candidatus Cloacimonadota bacterium]MDD4156011.1 ribosome biogenesis GTP-binding protein YihA/YsxC [Candidatus Cloacimonadota bacterium]